MSLKSIPKDIQKLYEIHEKKHAIAILNEDFPDEFKDILKVLKAFRLKRSMITADGGRKSPIALALDASFTELGWNEKGFDTKIVIDKAELASPTHKVDCFKNRVALEIEWNNKDPFYDRDLNNFRLLFDLRAISVGVIITRCSHLQKIFQKLGKGKSYGNSTTHLGKLIPRIEGGSGGGCPILVFGISDKLYDSKN
jgi:hypothetical protein